MAQLSRKNLENTKKTISDSTDISEESKKEFLGQMESGFGGTSLAHVMTFAQGHANMLLKDAQNSPLHKSRFQMEKQRELLKDRPGQRGFFS
jgi:hypothetical protein